ncbi:MAG TPA: DUF58 domain-containing protein [Rhodanobacteraceae bacterium]
MMPTDSTESAERVKGITRVDVAELVALRARALQPAEQPAHRRAAVAGGHASAARGRGMDYAESRAYQPGDDVRHIDWRRTARSGKFHTKLFEADRERGVLIAIDTHATMRFGTRQRFKSVAAARAAAWLAWTAVRGGDRVGALAFGDVRAAIDPQIGARGALAVVGAVAEWDAKAAAASVTGTEILSAVAQRAERLAPRGGRFWLLSDGWCVDAAARQALARLARRTDVVVVVVADPLEHALPPAGSYTFEAATGVRPVDLTGGAARAAFQHSLGRGERELLEVCRAAGIETAVLTTLDEPDRVLAPFWRRRRARS